MLRSTVWGWGHPKGARWGRLPVAAGSQLGASGVKPPDGVGAEAPSWSQLGSRESPAGEQVLGEM